MDFCHSSNVHHLYCKHTTVDLFCSHGARAFVLSGLLQMLLNQPCCKCLWLHVSSLPSEVGMSRTNEADSVC